MGREMMAGGKRMPARPGGPFRINPGRVLLYLVGIMVLVFLLTPLVLIPLLSFGSSAWLQFPPPGWTLTWYKQLFQSPEWVAAMINSLRIAVAVVAISLVLGVPAAYALVWGNFRGKEILSAIFVAPMIVPVVIVAIAVYILFLRLGLTGTFVGIVLAHSALALPFVIINVSNAFRSFDPTLERAAVSCGAHPIIVFFRVVLPCIMPGIVAGGLFAFVTSWDEVVVAIFITDPSLVTLPVKMWSTLRLELTPVIAAASTILIALSFIVLTSATVRGRDRQAQES